MKSFIDLKSTLIIDLETVSLTKDFYDLSEAMQKCWKEKVARDPELSILTPEDSYKKAAALYPEFSKIVSLSFGRYTENADKELGLIVDDYSGDNEALILEQFKLLTNEIGFGLVLVAHNGKNFDYPFLIKRYLINGITVPKNIDIRGKKPWEIKHLDTAEIWSCGSSKGYAKLSLLCAVFGIPTSKDDIDGSQVGNVYYNEENGIKRIATYCRKDVVVTAQVYLKLTETPIIADYLVVLAEHVAEPII